MSKKVSELVGAELALWVARIEVAAGRYTFDPAVANLPLITLCDGEPSHVFGPGTVHFAGMRGEHIARGPSYGEWVPHENWGKGGPLIERHGITITDAVSKVEGQWSAGKVIWLPDHDEWQHGPTPLIAAMRALVASVYGDNVPDEVEP